MLPGNPDHAFSLLAAPKPLQSQAFALLDIGPASRAAM